MKKRTRRCMDDKAKEKKEKDDKAKEKKEMNNQVKIWTIVQKEEGLSF